MGIEFIRLHFDIHKGIRINCLGAGCKKDLSGEHHAVFQILKILVCHCIDDWTKHIPQEFDSFHASIVLGSHHYTDTGKTVIRSHTLKMGIEPTGDESGLKHGRVKNRFQNEVTAIHIRCHLSPVIRVYHTFESSVHISKCIKREVFSNSGTTDTALHQ